MLYSVLSSYLLTLKLVRKPFKGRFGTITNSTCQTEEAMIFFIATPHLYRPPFCQ